MAAVAIYVHGTAQARAVQEAKCREWVEANGHQVALVRHDVAPSRPSLDQLTAEISDEKFEMILAAEPSVFSRDLQVLRNLIRTARSAFVKVVTANGFDLTDETTLFMTQMEMLHAEYQGDREEALLRALKRRGMKRVVADLTDAEHDALKGYVGNVNPAADSALRKILEGVQRLEENPAADPTLKKFGMSRHDLQQPDSPEGL